MRTRSRSPRRREARQQRPRPGFTIVEVLVAIVLLSAGILVLASSSAVLLRQMTSSKQAVIAASVASERLELLRSYNRCSAIRDSTATTRGMTERWDAVSVEGTGLNGWVPLTYDVSYDDRGVTRTRRISTRIPCTV